MKKRELLKRIEELEQRVAMLEASRAVIYLWYPWTTNPYPAYPNPVITWDTSSTAVTYL